MTLTTRGDRHATAAGLAAVAFLAPLAALAIACSSATPVEDDAGADSGHDAEGETDGAPDAESGADADADADVDAQADSTADGAVDADSVSDGDPDVTECPASHQVCNLSPECPAEEVCLHHECVCMFGRDYEIQIVSANVYARAGGGHCWDGEAPTCEDPDPYAVVTVDDLESDYADSYTTATVPDTVMPSWIETFTVHMTRRLQYGVSLWDADPAPDDGEDDLILDLPPLFWFVEENLQNGGIRVCSSDPRTETCVVLVLSPL